MKIYTETAGLALILMLCLVFSSACSFGENAAAPTPSSAITLPQTTASLTNANADVRLLFVNVGKADALIICANDRNYLVDAGEKSSVPKLLGAMRLLGIDAFDGVFLTHTHSDHIGGMEALASHCGISMLYRANYSQPSKKGVNKFDELSAELALPQTILQAGDALHLTENVDIRVLGPLVYNEEDDNDNSLVLMLVANGRKILLTGDMQFAEEETLLSSGCELHAEVLKVGNHGNPDATSNAFADAVAPSLAVISTDTSVDTDSANKRVLEALSGAEIHITQDYRYGLMLAVSADGSMKLYAPETPQSSSSSLSIIGIDKKAQTITIRNEGEKTDISGFMILSEKGGELFVFPEGTQIDPGQSLSVAAYGGVGDYIWDEEEKPWNSKKADAGILFDQFGNELFRLDSK